MQVDYLIVGQGICGTLLSWFLHKEGKTFLVIDEEKNDTASKVAAGIINPVTGRRYVYSWMIDEVMPFSHNTYVQFGKHLDSEFISQKSIIDFFPSVQMRDAFITRIIEDDRYLNTYPDQNYFNQFFNYHFGCGEIKPAYLVNMQLIMASWRNYLLQNQLLQSHNLNLQDIKLHHDFIEYNGITAKVIIFCDGVAAMNNPWFNMLPFAVNKGEALIIESEGLTNEHIFKKGLILSPLPVKNTYWVGSNYQWEFENEEPSSKFYEHATQLLNRWLKSPYKVLFHHATVRPATVERRPFVGMHPHMQNVGILNGMGTKGASLAPYFAYQLAQHLVYGFPIAPEADISRFSRILSREKN